MDIERNHPYVKEAVEMITQCAHLVSNGEIEQLVRDELNKRMDQWLAESQKNVGGRVLGYDEQRDGVTVGLLRRPSLEPWDDFTCQESKNNLASASCQAGQKTIFQQSVKQFFAS